MKKFLISKTPFIRSVDLGSMSTTRMMYDYLVAFISFIMFGFVINGLIPYINGEITQVYYLIKPFINVLVGILCSVTFEAIYILIFKKVKGFRALITETHYSFGFMVGLVISLLLPVRVPLYIIIIGCFIGNICLKMIFGGLGKNIFNPALLAYAILFVVFNKIIVNSMNEQVLILSNTLNITATQAPVPAMRELMLKLGNLSFTSSSLIRQFGSLFNLFVGFKGGNLGEVSGFLCVLAYIYLVIRKSINWRVPIFYVATVFVISYAAAIINKMNGTLYGIWFPVFNLLSGSILFGAVFLATDYVTTPKTPNGKIIYAILLGIVTSFIRLLIGFDGVCISIILVSLLTPVIDLIASKIRGPIINSKVIIYYVLISFVFLIISAYIVYQTTNLSFFNKIFKN
ncbi:MAG: RnfABCDGE type electron transport complex subunit D [Bacilli bacterium]|nr:RnfABCDGE type electron transport complex subunit D [Bacilli bacterium]